MSSFKHLPKHILSSRFIFSGVDINKQLNHSYGSKDVVRTIECEIADKKKSNQGWFAVIAIVINKVMKRLREHDRFEVFVRQH